jgi:hypothetical protein
MRSVTPAGLEWRTIGRMALGFEGDVADYHALYPRGCPPVVVDAMANANHFLDRATLFSAAHSALHLGRGLAIIANRIPLWLHVTEWSAALRGFLAR